MKIAVAQWTSGANIDANLAQLETYASWAAADGVTMLFAPEYSLCLAADPRANVAGRTDAAIAAVQSIARNAGLWMHAGSIPVPFGGDRCANRSLVVDANGAIVATYDKIHLFEAALADGESWREADVYVAGTQPVCVPTPIGVLGLSTCYDMRFPALFEAYGRVPVDAIALPSAFTAQTGAAHWHALLRARAIEAQAFVIAAAQTGHHSDGRHTFGHSLVVDPWGRVILDLGDAPGVGCCVIDSAAIAAARRQVPALRNKAEFATPQIVDLRR